MRIWCDNSTCSAVTHLEGGVNIANMHAQLCRDGWTIHDDGNLLLCPRCGPTFRLDLGEPT